MLTTTIGKSQHFGEAFSPPKKRQNVEKMLIVFFFKYQVLLCPFWPSKFRVCVPFFHSTFLGPSPLHNKAGTGCSPSREKKHGIVGLTLNPSHPILIMRKHKSFRHLGLSTCLGQNFEDLSVEQHDHSAQPTCSQVFASKARETFWWNICCNSLACEGTPGIQHLL